MLLNVDLSPRAAGGVWIYRGSPASLASYRDKTALEMERLDAETRRRDSTRSLRRRENTLPMAGIPRR